MQVRNKHLQHAKTRLTYLIALLLRNRLRIFANKNCPKRRQPIPTMCVYIHYML